MKFTVKAYNTHINYLPFIGMFLENVETDIIEIEVDATEENEAIGKARKLVREREKFEVIKIK
jgi:hypothetical protein